MFHSAAPYMEALGKTLIHSIWVGMMLAGLLKFMLFLLPSGLAQVRYRLAGFFMLLYLSAVALLIVRLFPWNGMYGDQPGTIPLLSTLSLSFYFNQVAAESSTHMFWRICFFLYLAGVLVMLLRIFPGIYFLRSLRINALNVEGPWRERFERLVGRTGIRRRVSLLESARIGVPIIIGVARPVVIVPVGMLTHLPAEQVETILLHELYHLKRLDFLINVLQLVIEALFFYNPAVWIISGIMRVEREHSCDDLVLRQHVPPLVYAKALYQISERNHRVGLIAPGASGPRRPGLQHRIYRILNPNTMRTNVRAKIVSLLFLAAGLVILTLATGFRSGFTIQKTAGMEPLYTMKSKPDKDHIDPPETVNPIAEPLLDTVPVPASKPRAEGKADVVEDQQMEDPRTADEAERAEILESIDWDKIQEEVEKATAEVMEDIDWEEMHEEIERATAEVMESIDWEEIQEEMKESMKELKEVEWEQMKSDIHESMKEIDMDEIRREVEESIREIDWDQMRMDLEHMKIELDSMKHDLARDREHS